MSTTQQAAESGVALAVKAAPPVSVSIATIAGFHISEIILWTTLIYTLLLIGHKIYQIYKDVTED